jgi:O-antigen/teichoic acid export membrane protein
VRSSLRRNFSWTLVGNLTYAACQWAIVVAIAKLGSPELVGRFTLAVAVCAPIMIATGLGLRTVQANDVGRDYPFAVYLGLRVITMVIAVTSIGIVAAIGYRASLGVILAYAGAKVAEATSEIVWAQLQQQERMAQIARSMVTKGATAVVAVTIALAVTHDLVIATAALAAAWFVTLAGYDLAVARTFDQPLRPSFARGPLARLARTALPLGIVMMIGSYAANVPRYIVDHFHGARELGVFSAIANLMLVGTTLMTALGQTTTPRLARAYLDRDRRELWRLARILLGVATILGTGGVAVAVIAGRPILGLLYTADYASHADVLVVVMVAAFATNVASVFGVMVTATGEYQRQIALQLINLVVALAVGWRLVPAYGALGAAWALVASTTATALVFGALAVARVRAL